MSDADYAHCECSHCSNPSGPCKLCMAVDRADGAALAERAAVVAWLRFREGRHMVASEEAARAQSYAQALEHGSFRGAFRSAADAIERGDHATGSADDRP